MTRKPGARDRMVVFEVSTAKPLPIGQQIFIAGDQPILGNWRADGFPLTRMDELVWAASAVVEGSAPIAFKVTRGSWATEAVNEDGTIPGNLSVDPVNKPKMAVRVTRWKDGA